MYYNNITEYVVFPRTGVKDAGGGKIRKEKGELYGKDIKETDSASVIRSDLMLLRTGRHGDGGVVCGICAGADADRDGAGWR